MSEVPIEGVNSEIFQRLENTRVDHATKQASVLDVIMAIGEMPSKAASVYYTRLDSALTTKCCHLRINGKGRLTPVANAKTLIEIVWALGGKKAKAFRVQCAEYICRILGGDPTLVREMELRRDTTPDEQRDFFMKGIQTPALPPMEDMGYLKPRADSADATNLLNATIRQYIACPGRDVFVIVQGVISDVILGEWPKAFKTTHNIDQRHNGPDFMLPDQLSMRYTLQMKAIRMLRASNGIYEHNGDLFVETFRRECMQIKGLFTEMQGIYQEPTELLAVRQALNPTQARQPMALTFNVDTMHMVQYNNN